MSTNKISIEQAKAWFNKFSSLGKTQLCDINTEIVGKCRRYETLTDIEIEQLWLKEQKRLKDLNDIVDTFPILKPNQKQYSQEEVDRLLDQQAARTTAQVLKNNKKFNESLFRNNIDKFSDEDKLKAIEILLKSSDFRFEVSGTAQDGGKYSEFDITKIKVIKSNLDYEGMNSLSGKVFETTFCIVKP